MGPFGITPFAPDPGTTPAASAAWHRSEAGRLRQAASVLRAAGAEGSGPAAAELHPAGLTTYVKGEAA